MAFQLSPGVLVVEKDFTSIVPAVATSTGAFAGLFQWGPVLDPVTVSSENVLVQRFGKPNDSVAQSFFTAANFLAYTNNLLVTRVDTANARNATAVQTGTVGTIALNNGGSGYQTSDKVVISAPDVEGGTQATATITVKNGLIINIAVVDGGSNYTSQTQITLSSPGGNGTTATAEPVIQGGVITSINITNKGSGYSVDPSVTVTDLGGGDGFIPGTITRVNGVITNLVITNHGTGYLNPPTVSITNFQGGASTGSSFNATPTVVEGSGVKIKNSTNYDEMYANGEGIVGPWAARCPGSLGNSIKVYLVDSGSWNDTTNNWPTYKNEFDSAPGTSDYAARFGASDDEVHVLVVDSDGKWTGVAGTVLEKYAYLSKASDAQRADGTINYYKEVLNTQSAYIWWMDHEPLTNWGSLAEDGTEFDTLGNVQVSQLSGGVDDFAADDGDYIDGYALYRNTELYDISLVPTGKVSATVSKYVIENVAEFRKDCVAFVSPINIANGDVIRGSGSDAVNAILAFRNDTSFNVNSSYGVLDTGFKYQYDRYNDTYRWVPLNGDVAGLCARTDYTNDAWWSPGGFNRGQIKSVVKLAVNPGQTERDDLYKSGVNPVVSFRGQGTILYGDKTLLTRPSAFDRINVRRLFIVLEKAIATAAKYQLFEFNDSFTRAMFKNMVEPFLRDVQGRRGVIDFRVKCDENNNTGEVIDRNEFVADIFIKPARSINFITLNFIAARTSVSFEEIGA